MPTFTTCKTYWNWKCVNVDRVEKISRPAWAIFILKFKWFTTFYRYWCCKMFYVLLNILNSKTYYVIFKCIYLKKKRGHHGQDVCFKYTRLCGFYHSRVTSAIFFLGGKRGPETYLQAILVKTLLWSKQKQFLIFTYLTNMNQYCLVIFF